MLNRAASMAVATARKVKTYLTPGRVWTMTAPRGEVEVKAGLIYEGRVVGIIHFSPSSGTVLPLGIPSSMFGRNVSLEEIKRLLPEIVQGLEVLNGAEYRDPENAWIVPLAYKGMIVSHLKIYADGIHIIPDYPAEQEMQAYAR